MKFKHRDRFRKMIKRWNWYDTDEEQLEHWVHVGAENRKKCSCEMCSNPRKSSWYQGDNELTMQERKAKEDYEDQLEECNIADDRE